MWHAFSTLQEVLDVAHVGDVGFDLHPRGGRGLGVVGALALGRWLVVGGSPVFVVFFLLLLLLLLLLFLVVGALEDGPPFSCEFFSMSEG